MTPKSTKQRCIKFLKNRGFEMDWSTVEKDVYGHWNGTMDAIGKFSIQGECQGIPCWGETKAEFWRDCELTAFDNEDQLEECTDVDCEFHNS